MIIPDSRKGSILFLISALVLMVFAVCYNVQIRNLDSSWVEPPAQGGEKWNPILFRSLTFGHWPLGVDWLWMRTLQDPAISHVKRGEHPPAYFDYDLASDMDPAFYEVYAHGANLLAIIRDDISGARDILTKGELFRKRELPGYSKGFQERYWGNAWALPLTLAYIYLYELDDMPNAALAYQEAASISGAPEYLQSLVKRLQTREGQFEVAKKLLAFMISANRDPRAREKLERRRVSLLLAEDLYKLNEQFRRYLGTLSEYRAAYSISPQKMKAYWERFRRKERIPERDGFGGRLSLDASGKIVSSTPRDRVFGLE